MFVIHDEEEKTMLVLYHKDGSEVAAWPLTVGDCWRLGCDLLTAWMRRAKNERTAED